jgi:hypothetical protein
LALAFVAHRSDLGQLMRQAVRKDDRERLKRFEWFGDAFNELVKADARGPSLDG